MKIVNIIGLCMVWLIISLPFASASSLSVVSISGEDNVENFYKSSDVVSIELLAGITGEASLERDQLRVYVDDSDSYAIFDSCVLAAGTDSYNCFLDKTVFGQSGTHQFKIQLYNDITKLQENALPEIEKIEPLTVDNIPPAVELIDVAESVTNNPNIRVDFEVRDQAITGNQALCSGIKELEIRMNEPGGPLLTTIPGDGSCYMKGNPTVTINEPDGMKTICIVASDMLNQVDQAAHCDTFALDRAAPVVASIKITDQNFEEIQFLSSAGGLSTNVLIEFDDLSLVKSTVTADFSHITTSGGYINRLPDAWQNDTAIYTNVPTNGFQSCSIGIHAEDQLGNIHAQSVSCSVQIDNSGPITQSLETGAVAANALSVIGKNTLIQITFNELGVGMEEKKVYLDLTRISGQAKRRAQECVASGNNWICSWNVTANQPDGEIQLGVHADTQDDLGNRVALEGRSFGVVLDTTPPTILSESYRIIGGPFSAANLTARGDQVEFSVKAENFDCGSSYADFSIFGGDEHTSPATCDETAGELTFVASVDVSGYYVADPIIYIGDIGGNKVSSTTSITVYATKEDELHPNYWRQNTPVCSPTPVDRNAASLINYNVICKIPFISSNPDAIMTLFSLDKGGCAGPGDDLDYFVDINAFNTGPATQPAKKDIYLSMYLDRREMDIDRLTITCPAYIGTRLETEIVVNPEQENITVSFEFQNDPAGTITSEVSDMLGDISKSRLKIGEKLEKLEGIIAYGELICRLKSTIMGIISTLDTIIFALQAVSIVDPTDSAEKAQDAICKQGMIMKKVYSSKIYPVADTFCKALDCNIGSNKDKTLTGGVLAGGVPWCKAVKDYQKNLYSKVGGAGGKLLNSTITIIPHDIKESLIWSSICLCLPGIVKNWKKYIEVDCKYGLCLFDEVQKQGLDVSFCEGERAYDKCAFVMGQLFSASPFGTLQKFMDRTIEALAHAEALIITSIVGPICDGLCDIPDRKIAYLACALPKSAQGLIDAYRSVEQMIDSDYWKVDSYNYCEEFESAKNSKVQKKEIEV